MTRLLICIFACVLGALNAARSGTADDLSYEATGKIDYRAFTYSSTQHQATVSFHLAVQGCRWRIRAWFDGRDAPDYYEVAYDGRQILFLQSLESSARRRRQRGSKATNVATAAIFPGDVYYNEALPEVTPIWFSLASSCYLDSVPPGIMEPPMPIDVLGVRYGMPIHPKLKYTATRMAGPLRLPSEVVYYSGPTIIDKRGKRFVFPKPYDAGFTNAIYTVDSVTNIFGLHFPLLARLMLFSPKTNAASANALRLAGEYRLAVHTVHLLTNRPPLRPTIPGATLVADHRFDAELGTPYLFWLNQGNDWPSEPAIRAGEHFQRFKEAVARRTGRIPSGRSALMCIIILAMLVVPGVFLLAKRRQRVDGIVRNSDRKS